MQQDEGERGRGKKGRKGNRGGSDAGDERPPSRSSKGKKKKHGDDGEDRSHGDDHNVGNGDRGDEKAVCSTPAPLAGWAKGVTVEYTPKARDQSGKKSKRAVPGLCYVADFISPEEEAALVEAIDGMEWNGVLQRRSQHYGYDWHPQTNIIDPATKQPLPDFVAGVIKRMVEQKLVPYEFDQMIIHEYMPGQGIAPHMDKLCFDNYIVSLSLASPVIMRFDSCTGKERTKILLQPRSLLILCGEARYRWRHSIGATDFDMVNGVKVMRSRRVSITLRRGLQAHEF